MECIIKTQKAKIIVNPHIGLIGQSIKSQLFKQTIIETMFFEKEINQLIARLVYSVDCFNVSMDNVKVINLAIGKAYLTLTLTKNNGMVNIEAII